MSRADRPGVQVWQLDGGGLRGGDPLPTQGVTHRCSQNRDPALRRAYPLGNLLRRVCLCPGMQARTLVLDGPPGYIPPQDLLVRCKGTQRHSKGSHAERISGLRGVGAEGPGSRTTVSSRLASARHLLAPEWLTPRVSTHTIRCGAVAPPTEGERAARRVSSPCHPTKGGGARHSLGAGVREGGEGGPIGPWAGRALVWRTPAAGLGMLAARAGRAALEGCARRPGPHELLNS